MSKIICIDFDGVLHSYSSGWKGADIIPDPPIPGAIDWLRAMIETGEDIRIFSARCNTAYGILAMKRWFREWGVPGWSIRQLTFEPGKPPAHVIIDDRAMQFTGGWPAPADVLGFKPYRYGRGAAQPKS